MEPKQIIRNYIFKSTHNFAMNGAMAMNIIMDGDVSDEYSIDSTSMTTLANGDILVLVIYRKDKDV